MSCGGNSFDGDNDRFVKTVMNEINDIDQHKKNINFSSFDWRAIDEMVYYI